VIESFKKEGFSVAYNWPYFGGRLTEQYGKPQERHHVVQVELNRALYMNEVTKQIDPEWRIVSDRLNHVLRRISDAASNQFARV
jgi:N-formylglutamate amidohydrolase